MPLGAFGRPGLAKLRTAYFKVRFQKPYSLKAFIADQLDRRKSVVSPFFCLRVARRPEFMFPLFFSGSVSQRTIKGPGGEQIPFDIEKNNDHKIFLLRALGYQVLSVGVCFIPIPGSSSRGLILLFIEIGYQQSSCHHAGCFGRNW